MNIEKIVADINEYDSLSITIEGIDKDGRIVFGFKLGCNGTETDWDNLVIACSHNTEYRFFDKPTGNTIDAYKDWVSFELSLKNDEGYMELRVPNKLCLEAFQDVQEVMKRCKNH